MIYIRSFLVGLRSVAITSRFKTNSDLSKFGFTSEELEKFRSDLNNGSIFQPKTGCENTYKGHVHESKLGDVKNSTKIAKVAFKISRLQQECIGFKLQDNSKLGFKRARPGLDNLRSKRKSKGSDLQDNVKQGKKTIESTRSQSQLILRPQSHNSLLKLQDYTTVSIIPKRGDFSGFRFYIDSNILKLQVNVKVHSDKNRSQLDTNKSTLQKNIKAGIDSNRSAVHKFPSHLNGSSSNYRENKEDAERVQFNRKYSQIVSQLGPWQKENNGHRAAIHCKNKSRRKWSRFGKIYDNFGSMPFGAGSSGHRNGNEQKQSDEDRDLIRIYFKFILRLLLFLCKFSDISFTVIFTMCRPPDVDDALSFFF